VPHGSTARRILDVLGAHLDHEDAVTIWTGVWAPAVCAAVASADADMTAAEYGKIVKALGHLAAGVDEMYRIDNAKAPVARPRPVNWRRQTLITDFLPLALAAERRRMTRTERRRGNWRIPERQGDDDSTRTTLRRRSMMWDVRMTHVPTTGNMRRCGSARVA
jgi:hypothetical protein